jgi:hypothetical protein
MEAFGCTGSCAYKALLDGADAALDNIVVLEQQAVDFDAYLRWKA